MVDEREINYVVLSGIINNIQELKNNYIKFGITVNVYTKIKSKAFINCEAYEDLYNIYKDLFIKDKKVFIKGYLKTYSDKDNNIKSYVMVSDMSNNYDEIIKGRSVPYTRVDPDGVEVWNGKRCEAMSFDENDSEYLELKELYEEFE